jgi:transcriptional regulator with XRE-family HTH domain
MMGEELRKARERVGLTQEQLSFRAGYSRPYISQLERDLKSPTLDTLFRLCDALGIRASEFVALVERGRVADR